MPSDTIQPTKPAKPLVSVIIPVYNGERYLAEAIDSVLAQTHRPVEIIVVDDGSTDGTVAVLEPYKDKIRYVYQENQDTPTARNNGLSLAQGQFVLFLDADDYLALPTMIEEMLAIVEANPDIDVIHSGWHVVDEQRRILQTRRPWLEMPRLDTEAWFKWFPLRLNSMLFRRIPILQISGFNPILKNWEDADFVLRLSLTGCRFEWLPQITACYRQRAASKSHTNIPRHIVRGLRMREDLLARPDLPATVRDHKQQILYSYLLWGLDRLLAEMPCAEEPILEQLARLFNIAPYPKIETTFDIVAQSIKFEYQLKGRAEHMDRLIAILCQENPNLDPAALSWWAEVWWWYYLSRQNGDIARLIAPYHAEVVRKLQRYSAAERLKLGRLALLEGANPVYGDGLSLVEVLDTFKRDADLNTVRPLYIAYLWRLLKSRHWQAARQTLPKLWQG